MAMVTYILLLTALALCSLSAAAPERMPQPLPEESDMGEYLPAKAVQSAVAADPGGDHQSTTASQLSENDLDAMLQYLHLERVSETADLPADQNPGGDRQSTTASQLSESDLDAMLQYLHLERVSETADLPAGGQNPGGDYQSTTASQQSDCDLDTLLQYLHLERISESMGQNPGGDRQSTTTSQLSESDLDTMLQYLHLGRVSESTAIVAQVDPTTCGASYHDALNEVVRIKEECDDAAFYDCSQPLTIISTVHSGTYEISEPCESEGPFSTANKLLARCDMETDGGGWLVIQRRANNDSINFYRGWSDYEQGFGDLDSEFWYGLKNIYCLTTRDEVELQIDLEDESGNKVTWVYQEFRVAGPEDKYRLTIGPGEGPSESYDSMAPHNGRHFSTFDQDNDAYDSNCATNFRGGWWYNACHRSNPNGDHGSSGTQRPVWYNGSSYVYYPYVEMKIRRKN